MPGIDEPTDPFGDAISAAVDAVFRRFPEASGEVLTHALRAADVPPPVLGRAASDGDVIADLWPVALWCGGALVLALSGWQVAVSLWRGNGRGLVRALVGVMQYTLVTGSVLVVVSSISAVGDGFARWILVEGVQRPEFLALRAHLAPSAAPDVTPAVALVVGIVGIIGALVLWFELVTGQAVAVVLVIVAPIAAAGLAADATRRWFAALLRWCVGIAVAKPVMAVVAVVGARGLDDRASGVPEMLGALAVLLALVAVPPVLLRAAAAVTGPVSEVLDGHAGSVTVRRRPWTRISGGDGVRTGASMARVASPPDVSGRGSAESALTARLAAGRRIAGPTAGAPHAGQAWQRSALGVIAPRTQPSAATPHARVPSRPGGSVRPTRLATGIPS